MNERRNLDHDLDQLQQQLKELEIAYEKYFAGVDKREPFRDRTELARRLRFYTNRRIVWTDLKFRYQGLLSRFMSYCQYWDRILRLIDEGKYSRHTAKIHQSSGKPDLLPVDAGTSSRKEIERLHLELQEARRSCGLSGDTPSLSKIAEFIETQREKIQSRYGDRPVAFSIDVSSGKPSIKVSLKK